MVHLVGIGGVGMAALAVLLKARGERVTGCDLKASARTRWLEREGIPVAIGHSPDHLGVGDTAVVTAAAPADLPELAIAAKVRRRGEVLAELVNGVDSIAVAGSHGKTTTATFIAKLLRALGEEVSWAIGGETGDFPVAHAGGVAGPLVVEADESDGTLELYHPRLLVVNRCEYDHPEHFPDPAAYLAGFERAKARAGAVIESEGLALDGWELPVAGAHNRRNARAAIEVALRRGHSRAAIAAALPGVIAALPDRRFETLAVRADGARTITDYAHHPTEMACAVQMARECCRGTLRVLFQPHRYSRTRALLHDFPAAFAGADEVVILPVYAAFEKYLPGGDEAELYRVCREQQDPGARFYLARSREEAWAHAALSMAAGDVTLLLGAGDIIELRGRVEAWARGEPPAEARRILIGMGSNTWRSDLRNLDRYERTAAPAGRSGATLLDRPGLGAAIAWMAGIPGTIGGWVKMNAGAFGHAISEVIVRVKVDGRWLEKAECGFDYRTSAIEGEIEDVEFVANPPPAAKTAAEYRALRRHFPAHTWGSFFKNPPGDYAGRLLEAVGAKGLRVGGAYVWSEHANVIVAPPGEASASDVLALARLMKIAVRERFGVELQPEVRGILI